MEKNKNLLRWILSVILVLVTGAATYSIVAQETQNPIPPAVQTFSQEQLDQMLAPIALYPDALLAQVLTASAYPLDVVEANRFAKDNSNLKGDDLLNAAKDKDWDPSIKSLLGFPEVLAMLDKQLSWTTSLGHAFVYQQDVVMDTIQKLRNKAYEKGNLKTNKQQKVTVKEETPGQQIVIIEPASPTIVYVPTYDPYVVYGDWWYPSYPPYAYYPSGYVAGAAFLTGFVIGSYWGWGSWNYDWHHHHVYVHTNQYNAFIKHNYVHFDQYHLKSNIAAQPWQFHSKALQGTMTGKKFNLPSTSATIEKLHAGGKGFNKMKDQGLMQGGKLQGKNLEGLKGKDFHGKNLEGLKGKDFHGKNLEGLKGQDFHGKNLGAIKGNELHGKSFKGFQGSGSGPVIKSQGVHGNNFGGMKNIQGGATLKGPQLHGGNFGGGVKNIQGGATIQSHGFQGGNLGGGMKGIQGGGAISHAPGLHGGGGMGGHGSGHRGR